MATHRSIGRLCLAALALALALCLALYPLRAAGLGTRVRTPAYQSLLFDRGVVHTLDIRMEDWAGFLAACEDEEYRAWSVILDNEAFKNVGIRAKGNTSLSQVAAYGNGRYSFKIEFDHYESGKSYHGLDKLCLNNLIQDNTLLKDYFCYRMMAEAGVAAPLVSFVWVTVNGEDFGLYLAVEAVEDSFLARNYGADSGALYKPDSLSMGGGRGAGRDFDWGGFDGNFGGGPARGGDQNGGPGAHGGFDGGPGDFGGDFGGGFGGSDDVLLVYTDDDPASYPNIFDNAKTEVTAADQARLLASLQALNGQTDLEDVLDIPALVSYFAVHNFVCNFDSYTGSMIHNYYLYEQEGRLAMIPWDYNLAFGGFMGQSDAQALVNYPIDTPVSGQSVDARPMLRWIFGQQAYTDLYHAALQTLLDTWFTNGAFAAELAQVTALLDPYVAKDEAAFCSYADWQSAVQALAQFCSLRAESVVGQLDGSIPATAEGQAADDSALVTANGLSISAMGGMGGGMGGGPFAAAPGGMGDAAATPGAAPTLPDGEMPTFPNGEDGEMPTFPGGNEGEIPAFPGGADGGDLTPSDNNRTPPGDNFTPPGGEPTASGNSQWVLLGACLAVLLGGLAFAGLYRRR